MPLISKEYRELNRELHESNSNYGTGGANWSAYVSGVANAEQHGSVLDYGCGRGELAKSIVGPDVREYDPAIEGKDGTPEPADLVVCTDVLEHIEPVHLNAVLRDLVRVTVRKLFVNIATRPAEKTLNDGRNAHLIVESADWWRAKLQKHFRIAAWNQSDINVNAELFPRTATTAANDQPTKRRPLTADWTAKFNEIIAYSAANSDPFSRIDTIRMFEGVDDQVADVQVLCNTLEHVNDIDALLRRAIKASRKGVMATIRLQSPSEASMWRTMFERHLRITDWHIADGHLAMLGSPMIGVQGIRAVGAVDTDERWEQVKAAAQRIKPRLQVQPAHTKRAILACYGPSLRGNLKFLKQEAAEINSTIISVSGSHDFLLDNGVKPDLHIECDPRPHKADNIAKGIDGVTYYIASCCHAVVFDKLSGADVRLWHLSTPEHQQRIIDELGEDGRNSISGGGSVGLRAIPLLYALGYRDFSIYGMDCSFADDGTVQWAGKHAGKAMDVVPCQCGDRIFATAPILMTYATNFFETIQKVGDAQFRLYGDGLLQNMAAAYSRIPKDDLKAA